MTPFVVFGGSLLSAAASKKGRLLRNDLHFIEDLLLILEEIFVFVLALGVLALVMGVSVLLLGFINCFILIAIGTL